MFNINNRVREGAARRVSRQPHDVVLRDLVGLAVLRVGHRVSLTVLLELVGRLAIPLASVVAADMAIPSTSTRAC